MIYKIHNLCDMHDLSFSFTFAKEMTFNRRTRKFIQLFHPVYSFRYPLNIFVPNFLRECEYIGLDFFFFFNRHLF